MADDPKILNEAADLLTKVAELIQNSRTTNVATHSAARQNTIPVSRPSTNNIGTGSQTQNVRAGGGGPSTSTTTSSWEDRLVENFKNLFGGLPSKTTLQSVGGRPKPGSKGALNPNTGKYFWKRETWTHRFVCLAQKEQISAPSREEKDILRVAGLGEKKIVLNKESNASDVMVELLNVFPKLAQGGGFEFLRSGNRLRDLLLIMPPPVGYSVPFLKSCGIGQSIIYIRPIQANLDLDPVKSQDNNAESVCAIMFLYYFYSSLDTVCSYIFTCKFGKNCC